MSTNLTAHATVLIDAPKEKVWEALTNPTIIKRYFFGTDIVTDWRIGGPISFSGEFEGKYYQDKGIVLQFDPYCIIQYKYWSSLSGIPDLPENYLTITYEIRKEEDQTRLDISQENIRDEKTREHAEENWTLVLANLKRLVEDMNKVLAF